MSVFPTFEQDRIEALESIGDTILGAFKAKAYTRIQPSLLQPSGLFVDRSGEEIRRRTLELVDPSGHELCLRPDLTVPACRYAADASLVLPARLCYRGPAFRYVADDAPMQFAQVGAELIGGSAPDGEAEMLTLAVEALRACGLGEFRMIVGDLALFSALVDALPVPAQWRGRLKRHFWRTGYFETLLARMVAGAKNDAERAIERLHELAPGALRPAIEAMLDAEADSPLAGRTREDIVRRLMMQAADGAAPRLEPWVAELLKRFLAVRGRARPALDEIRSVIKPANGALDGALAAMERRIALLESLHIDPERIVFVGHFGRDLEYYTGFVFEFWCDVGGGALEVAGGGRYDHLMESMGAPRGTLAVGCALQPEKILRARGQG